MGQLNTLALAATCVIGLAFILIVVGLATTGWTENSGLFEYCFLSVCSSIPESAKTDELKATTAMVILGMLGSLCALACILIFLVLGLMDKMSEALGILPLVTLISSIAGGIFAIIGCIIFAAEYYELADPDYSFFLTLIGAIILIVGGVIGYKSKGGSGVGSA